MKMFNTGIAISLNLCSIQNLKELNAIRSARSLLPDHTYSPPSLLCSGVSPPGFVLSLFFIFLTLLFY